MKDKEKELSELNRKASHDALSIEERRILFFIGKCDEMGIKEIEDMMIVA